MHSSNIITKDVFFVDMCGGRSSTHLLKQRLTSSMLLLLLLVVIVDEQFNFSKQAGFKGDGLAAIATAFTQTAAVSACGIRV